MNGRLFLPGRHHGRSVLLEVQKLTLVVTVCRADATRLRAFKVRSRRQYEAITGEATALVDRHVFCETWEEANSELGGGDFGTLLVPVHRLNAKSRNETFMERF